MLRESPDSDDSMESLGGMEGFPLTTVSSVILLGLLCILFFFSAVYIMPAFEYLLISMLSM